MLVLSQFLAIVTHTNSSEYFTDTFGLCVKKYTVYHHITCMVWTHTLYPGSSET